ncbi:MAG: copper chaperone PCu(A)C [Oxalobacteraceae bacterium]|nr:copper chaperone PCu(A)C [Oxalobacteraceae bacterium]
MIKRLAFSFFTLLMMVNVKAHTVKAGSLVIEHAHARATVGSMPNSAAFLQVSNKGKSDDALISASTTIADRVELHTMSMEGDVMKMRSVESVELKAETSLAMKPGQGPHIMLFGLKKPLKAGEKFPMTLTFRKAGAVNVSVEVMDFTAHGNHGSGNAHEEHKH